MLRQFYDKVILSYPKSILLLMLVCIAALGYQARYLEIDASAETLLLEDDKDLAFTRKVNERYGSSDFLVLTYSPHADLLADTTLDSLRKLSAELLELERVESVMSILNVPLLESPPKPIKELIKNVPTLESPGIDKALAKEFFDVTIHMRPDYLLDIHSNEANLIIEDDLTKNEILKVSKEIFKNIGYMPERPYFYPHLTGNEFIKYMGTFVGLSGMGVTLAGIVVHLLNKNEQPIKENYDI